MEKKKMSVMKKILLVLLLMVFMIVLVIAIHTLRNYLIIKNLQNNFSQYANSTNYHTKMTSTNENGITTIINYYQKNEKAAMIIERTDDEYVKISIYDNGERADMFTIMKGEKVVTLGTNRLNSNGLTDDLDEESIGSRLYVSLMAKIRSVDLNGKECYKFSNFFSGSFMSEDENDEYYFEKETGLLLQNTFGTTNIMNEYEFDNVEDAIFIEPNIGEYRLNKGE